MSLLCVWQASMIEDAQSLVERKRKGGAEEKVMLQDATKLTQRLRFLVEEVQASPSVSVSTLDAAVTINHRSCVSCFFFFLQPQHTLPDVFVWLLSNNKRVAGTRVQARDLLYSSNQEEQGVHCGKVITLFLKVTEIDPTQ